MYMDNINFLYIDNNVVLDKTISIVIIKLNALII